MKKIIYIMAMFGLVTMSLASLKTGEAAAETTVIPRVTNFIILADESGSMFASDRESGKTKAFLSREVLLKLNEQIPDMDYTAALQIFLPQKTLIGPRQYDRNYFRSKIAKLYTRIDPKNEPVPTPLGSAILSLSKMLDQFTGKTAIIIVTDGMSNIGPSPFESAMEVWGTYPNTCFHIISLADKDEGRKIVRDVAGVNSCALADGRVLLSDDAAMENLVKRIFSTEVVMEEPPRQAAELLAATAEETPAAFNIMYFDFGKAEITADETGYLDANIDRLNADAGLKVRIEGHTDWTGSEGYNQGLSERRARAVYDYLINTGISPQRMESAGYGENRPAVSNLTAEGRRLNRRVEIRAAE